MINKTRMPNILVKDVPSEVLRYILKLQSEEKIQKGISQYSLSAVIIKIIKKQIASDARKSRKESD